MKITFVLPVAGLAGGIRVVAIHAAKLRARGHAVTIVSQPPRRPGRRVRLARALRGRFRSDPPEPSYFDGLDISHHVLERPRPVTDADLPDFALSVRPNGTLMLSLPDGWLQSHPLSQRSLELERRQLGRLGLRLVPATLSEPRHMQ